jgi:hypothetical protein
VGNKGTLSSLHFPSIAIVLGSALHRVNNTVIIQTPIGDFTTFYRTSKGHHGEPGPEDHLAQGTTPATGGESG